MKQPHIQCDTKDIGSIVLMPGDPARAKKIGEEYLSGKLIAYNREFCTYTGKYKGKKISVTSTGIGCPSTAIATEELINIGAKVLIRVGTGGGALKSYIKPGSVVIPTASIRQEGTTKEYVPLEWPAVADFDVITSLRTAAQKLQIKHYVGLNRTHDAFYGQASNIKHIGNLYNDPRMKMWDVPLYTSEMEASALFVIALLRGVKAGAVIAINADPEPLAEIVQESFSFETPNEKVHTKEALESVDRSIRVALEASLLLSD